MIHVQWPPDNSVTSMPWLLDESQYRYKVELRRSAARTVLQLHIHHHHLRGHRSNSQPASPRLPSFMHKVVEQMFLSDNVSFSSSARQHSHLPSLLCEMCQSFSHHSNGLVLYEWRLSMQLFGKVGTDKDTHTRRFPETGIKNKHPPLSRGDPRGSSSCHLWSMYTGARE